MKEQGRRIEDTVSHHALDLMVYEKSKEAVSATMLTPRDSAELRIHDDIERGDNASIKKGTNMPTSEVTCCGGAA